MNLSTALLAAVAGLALTSSASGAIVYFANQDIPIPTNFAGVSLDVDTGANATDLDGIPFGDINFFFGGAQISNDADVTIDMPRLQFVRVSTVSTDPAANLAPATLIGPGSTYAAGYGSSGDITMHFPPFTAGQQGYIGFEFTPNGGGGPLYGWLLVTLQSDGVTEGTIHEWAFEDSGGAILAGAIPEPGQAVLVLLAAFALVARRKYPSRSA